MEEREREREREREKYQHGKRENEGYCILYVFIASIMTNTMTCDIKREAWSWHLPGHLVLAKILCSRREQLTKEMYKFERI